MPKMLFFLFFFFKHVYPVEMANEVFSFMKSMCVVFPKQSQLHRQKALFLTTN